MRGHPASDISSNPLGAAVREIRHRLSLSQAEFAAMTGINQTTVSQYEIGRAKPSAKQVLRILSLGGGQHSAHPAECLPLIVLLEEELGVGFAETALIDNLLANLLVAGDRPQQAQVSRPQPSGSPSPAQKNEDPRMANLRDHLERYRDLAGQGKWAEAGRELEAVQKEVWK